LGHPFKILDFRLFAKADNLSQEEQTYLQAAGTWQFAEGAYAMIQGSKPQTLAYGLQDSPVGLAAWIVEKFRSWSDCAGDVEKRFTKDELLTTITLYWVTETINAANRLYYDSPHDVTSSQHTGRSGVPAAIARFTKDILPAPREWHANIISPTLQDATDTRRACRHNDDLAHNHRVRTEGKRFIHIEHKPGTTLLKSYISY
jgi:hypothetical protein